MKKLLLIKFQRGTSLIELLIYFGLLATVLIIATDLIIRTGEFSLEANTRNALQQDARFIINRLTYDIHQADLINTPAGLGDSSPTTLVFTVGPETHTYSLVGTDLEYQRQTGPPPLTQTANVNSNQTRVNSILFQRLGNTNGQPTIKITFQLETSKSQKGGPKVKTFEALVGQR